MGSKWFADVVFDYLMKNKNVEVTIQELMDETGKDRHQVQGAINNLRRRKGAIILSPSPGRVFVYQGMAQAQNIEREDGSVVSQVPGAQPPSNVKPVAFYPPAEAVMAKTEERLKANPDNRPPVGTVDPAQAATTVKTPGGTLVGKFVMPRPHTDNEFMRVISRTEERVLLEDAHGKVWRATEI